MHRIRGVKVRMCDGMHQMIGCEGRYVKRDTPPNRREGPNTRRDAPTVRREPTNFERTAPRPGGQYSLTGKRTGRIRAHPRVERKSGQTSRVPRTKETASRKVSPGSPDREHRKPGSKSRRP